MPLAQTAAEYAERYAAAFDDGGLIQGSWHTERDGRQLACALGVIGDEVNGPRDCPSQIMPRWLAQMVPHFFDRQSQDVAFAWGKAFTAELARLDGKVPFSVVHDWHANTVCQLGIDAAEKRGRDPAPHRALQALHRRALTGATIKASEWRPVLKDAYADADAAAYAYAVYAYAYAAAYADTDAAVYAYAYAAAYAVANTSADAWKVLADGMVAALSRVEAV